MTRSISRTLEYAYDDFCIAQMAAKMNKTAEYQKYLASSENWQNLFKANQTSHWWNGTDTGFTGFFQPRYLNGTWGYQDPLNCSNLDDYTGCSLTASGGETYESSIWEYNLSAPLPPSPPHPPASPAPGSNPPLPATPPTTKAHSSPSSAAPPSSPPASTTSTTKT